MLWEHEVARSNRVIPTLKRWSRNDSGVLMYLMAISHRGTEGTEFILAKKSPAEAFCLSFGQKKTETKKIISVSQWECLYINKCKK